jgi:hypothetical protein
MTLDPSDGSMKRNDLTMTTTMTYLLSAKAMIQVVVFDGDGCSSSSSILLFIEAGGKIFPPPVVVAGGEIPLRCVCLNLVRFQNKKIFSSQLCALS